MPYAHLRYHTSLDDVVLINYNNSRSIGKIVATEQSDKVIVLRFTELTPELLVHYSLSTVTDEEAPFAIKSGMVEVIQTNTRLLIDRSSIIDIAFIIPLQEVECGLFHLTGARNSYFIRYQCNRGGRVEPYGSSILQPRVIDTFSSRIFGSLNQLSASMKKLFYHHPEQDSVHKSFRMPFSYEAFFYISAKLVDSQDIIMNKIERTQRIILYYDDLSMKTSSRINQVQVIRFLTSRGLTSLRELLGVGIGVGLGKNRPTKSNPEVYCCINDIITSLELPDAMPPIFVLKPTAPLRCNGVDLIFTVETKCLHCNVRFSKVTVTSESTVLDRIPTAAIRSQTVTPYNGAMFFYGDSNSLCCVDNIDGGFAMCSSMEDEIPPFRLSLAVLSPLIASFGHTR